MLHRGHDREGVDLQAGLGDLLQDLFDGPAVAAKLLQVHPQFERAGEGGIPTGVQCGRHRRRFIAEDASGADTKTGQGSFGLAERLLCPLVVPAQNLFQFRKLLPLQLGRDGHGLVRDGVDRGGGEPGTSSLQLHPQQAAAGVQPHLEIFGELERGLIRSAQRKVDSASRGERRRRRRPGEPHRTAHRIAHGAALHHGAVLQLELEAGPSAIDLETITAGLEPAADLEAREHGRVGPMLGGDVEAERAHHAVQHRIGGD